MSTARLLELILWLVVNQLLFMQTYYILQSIVNNPSYSVSDFISSPKVATLQAYDKSYYCSLYPAECSKAQHGVYKYNNHPVYVTTVNNSLVMSDISSCYFPHPDLSSLSNLDTVHPQADTTIYPPIHPAKNKILIIFTTCNHLAYSVLSLASISRNDPNLYDLLIIDDHSTDGTQAYLSKKGYAVISHSTPRGLTYSWNLGYRLRYHDDTILTCSSYALDAGYKYIVFTNNDVLLPPCTTSILQGLLPRTPMLLPLTTTRGAGHNPAQSIMEFHPSLSSSHFEDYVADPLNMDAIQNMLTRMQQTSTNSSNLLKPSIFGGKPKFNGFFFAVNVDLMRPAAHNATLLFDPHTIMVGQEDLLIRKMISHNIVPKICGYLFVYHYKSITVKASKYVLGSLNETRNNLKLYHHDALTKHSLYHSYPTLRSLSMLESPKKNTAVAIAMAISDPKTNPTAGDVMTAQELGSALQKQYFVTIKYLYGVEEWYDLKEIQVLIAFLDSYDLSKIKQSASPQLITIAWMRNWFQRWLTNPSLGSFDLLLASSQPATNFFRDIKQFRQHCSKNCPSAMQHAFTSSTPIVDLLRIGTNIDVFYPTYLPPKRFHLDYAFTGNYWFVERDIMTFDPSQLSRNITGAIIGSNWEKAPVPLSWKTIIHPAVPYNTLPALYRRTSIIIDDANHVTKPWGSVNSRVFDALASGALVITNGKVGSQDAFNGLLPTYSTTDEMVSLLRRYLNDSLLYETTRWQLYQMVITHHSYNHRARELANIITNATDGFVTFISKNARVQSHEICDKPSPSICIAIRTHQDVATPEYRQQLQSRAAAITRNGCPASVLESPVMRSSKNRMYGYDVTETALQYLLQKECKWLMFTNGDNMYNVAWYEEVTRAILTDPDLVAVAWDFVTHHPRGANLTSFQQSIHVDVARGYIDLGSILFRASALRDINASFLPDALKTKDIYARDYFLINKLMGTFGKAKIALLHDVLMFHQ